MFKLDCKSLKFSGHALHRMFQRKLTKNDIVKVLSCHELVAAYEDDKPYPSFLILGWKDKTPIHVVVAQDLETKTCIIITCYIPELNLWELDFKTRKRS